MRDLAARMETDVEPGRMPAAAAARRIIQASGLETR